ncbi:MAG: universal stress protein [Deltaproteobacteria bacterium]|jgi:nucleotide-binding universal stress UspA family protein|nr:universal stress protein [Deltaproteobacteria bacterium]
MKIMVCYDGSEAAESALKLAKEHAEIFKTGIFIVTALEGSPQEQLGSLEKVELLLDDAKILLASDTIDVETKLLQANNLGVGENLVIFARENGVKEIIIGLKKLSKVGKLITGSTAQHVILHAECPVVAVK